MNSHFQFYNTYINIALLAESFFLISLSQKHSKISKISFIAAKYRFCFKIKSYVEIANDLLQTVLQ